MKGTFSFVPIASPLHGEEARTRIVGTLEDPLAQAGGIERPADGAPIDQPLVYVLLTGGTERETLRLIRRRRAQAGREPVVLVAHPGHNSLAAAMEVLARVRQDGGSGQIVHLDGKASEPLREAAHLSQVALSMCRARLGRVGEPSEWLVASAHAPEVVRQTWGPELVPISLEELDRSLAREKPDEALARRLLGQARRSDVPEDEILKASAVYRALEGLVAEHRLWGLTVRCFDLVKNQGTTGCLALSQLMDDGVPAGCEGDIPSAVALLWLHLLTGDVPWMTNPARISLEKGELTLAHCTVPRSLVRGYDVRTHFESGMGVAIGGDLAPGPVTLVRIGGARLEKLWCHEGELVGPLHDEALCRTQALIRLEKDALQGLLERPLGNHLIVVPGRQAGRAQASRRLILGD